MFNSSIERISKASQRMAAQVHLRSLRDSFIIAIPFLVLAGLIIVVNFVLLDPDGFTRNLLSQQVMHYIRELGGRILNGTMNILSVMLVVLVAFNLATKKGAESPIIPAMVSLACFFSLMPTGWSVIPDGETEFYHVSGLVPYQLLNANGVFMAIMTAFISTEVFLRVSASKRLRINLGDDVPPMVTQTFNALFAIMLTIGGYAIIAWLTQLLTGMEVYEAIQHAIQAPLVHLTTGLPGFLALGFTANFLFALGIHPGGIVNPILEPPLLVAMNQNMVAFAAGEIPPHVIVLPFRDLYGHLGGTGSTLALLLAIFIRSKISGHRKFAKTVAGPSVFNINEPVIFGLPIVMNPLIIIPFVLYPLINYVIAYYATVAGLVGKIVAYTPWSVPPLMSGYLASGGDYRNVILQALLIILGVFCYMPFLIAWERGLRKKQGEKIVESMMKPAVDMPFTEQRDSASGGAETVDAQQEYGKTLSDKTLLLVCNEGMSTSIMAKKMQKQAQSMGLNTRVYAINSGRLETEYKKADVILLGPQLAYMKNDILDLVGHALPVEPLSPEHFAKMDGEGALKSAAELLQHR